MKRTISESVCTLLLLLIPVWMLACSGPADSDRPPTYTVSGTVTMNGQPLEGATVTFQLADGSRSATGITDAGGRYELTTFTGGDGAVPGEYRVTVKKFENPPGAPKTWDEMEDPETGVFVPENVLPDRYSNAQTSGLTATVTEGRNTFDFELDG